MFCLFVREAKFKLFHPPSIKRRKPLADTWPNRRDAPEWFTMSQDFNPSYFLPLSLQPAAPVQHSAALRQGDLCSYVTVLPPPTPLNQHGSACRLLHSEQQQQQQLSTCPRPRSPVGAGATLSADSAARGSTPERRQCRITDTCGIFTAELRSALLLQADEPL